MPIRVLLISDVRLYREGVEAALGRRPAISIAGTASRVDTAVERVAALNPDVILVDVATRDSLAGVRALRAAAPTAKIVVFAVDESSADIPSYAEAGAVGYVPCEASLDDLTATVECIMREETPCSPRVAATLFKRIHVLGAMGRADVACDAGALSRREQEILALLRRGLSNKEIAQTLTIGVATVKNHVHSVLAKLHVNTRAEAARSRGSSPRI
jgi:two-component system, NarL family, nitrate/nitrite response regulator NarL